MDVKKEILDIISDFIEIPEEGLSFDEPLKASSGINSFVFLSMVSAFEEHFNISIPNTQIEKFRTLNDIVTYIESAL